MIVGVIGSGSIGPDLAYGFLSRVGKGGTVWLMDIKQEALDAGVERIRGYIKKGLAKGKIAPKAAKAMEAALKTTTELGDLHDCAYVLEAASEDLDVKRGILDKLEGIVAKDCLIGFATSGIPRALIAAEARHPERCFVNHPFFPAWRSPPVEVVLSGDEALGERMMGMLTRLGKVPIVTEDVECFAVDDVFVNYCAEAARIVQDGLATIPQVDAIVNAAIGGGGPFNVMDLCGGTALGGHCLELLQEAHDGNEWFAPPQRLLEQGDKPWIDYKEPGDPTHDDETRDAVLNRMLAVLMARTYYVVEQGICEATSFNWLLRMALGFRKGLLEVAEDLGAERVHQICRDYATDNTGFEIPDCITSEQLPAFFRHLRVTRQGNVAIVEIFRPEAMNALNRATMLELQQLFLALSADDDVHGVVLTSYQGALAGADIGELSKLKSAEEAEQMCLNGQNILAEIAAFPKPVVAAVNGAVMGGGAELSMACWERVVGKRLMLAQPEVKLGCIPGYGGTQRLPRLIGLEQGLDLLRTGRVVGAKEACEWGWAHGQPENDVVEAAVVLVKQHLADEITLKPVNPESMELLDELPTVDIGHLSRAVDRILVDLVRESLVLPLDEGTTAEAKAFSRCTELVDYTVGMTNFVVNGPRAQACFRHE